MTRVSEQPRLRALLEAGIALTPAGLPPASLFALSLWTGWTISVVAGELWVRYTRGLRVAGIPAGDIEHGDT